MLKPRQMKLAELMAFHPEMTNEQYAEEIGIAAATVYEWKKSEEFLDYLHKICEKRFRSYENMAVQKLLENAERGNNKAIEYLLNYIGYKPVEQQQVDMTANIQIDYGDGE